MSRALSGKGRKVRKGRPETSRGLQYCSLLRSSLSLSGGDRKKPPRNGVYPSLDPQHQSAARLGSLLQHPEQLVLFLGRVIFATCEQEISPMSFRTLKLGPLCVLKTIKRLWTAGVKECCAGNTRWRLLSTRAARYSALQLKVDLVSTIVVVVSQHWDSGSFKVVHDEPLHSTTAITGVSMVQYRLEPPSPLEYLPAPRGRSVRGLVRV